MSLVKDTPANLIDSFVLFREAFRKVFPHGTRFTSQDVARWVELYTKIKSPPDPDLDACMHNTIVLGRLMRQQAADLGIQECGSYGNRPFYIVKGA